MIQKEVVNSILTAEKKYFCTTNALIPPKTLHLSSPIILLMDHCPTFLKRNKTEKRYYLSPFQNIIYYNDECLSFFL